MGNYALKNSPVLQLPSEFSMRPWWQNIQLPPLALSRRITQKDDRVTTLRTPWTKPSETVVRNYPRMLTFICACSWFRHQRWKV